MNCKSLLLIGLLACSVPNGYADIWNSPYGQNQHKEKIYYSSFDQSPKTLNPARAYSSNEIRFIAQIYEPLLQYNYVKRPYTLEPLTAMQMPVATYYDKKGNVLNENAANIAYSVYDITITPGIYYQPHPALAKDSEGKFVYHQVNAAQLDSMRALSDFKKTGTRELHAQDYIYQIKSLARPKVNSPILGFMEKHIVGLTEYAKLLRKVNNKHIHQFFDLRKYPLSGVTLIDDYHLQIKVKRKYPQFLYWLAMPFFAPLPWEADKFYSQEGMSQHNISLDWYPIGTGPYMLTKNNPNGEMILERNPNFHEAYFPGDGDRLPFIDKFIFSLEKEAIPRWNKFLQGYYDSSAISSDSFDQAIKLNKQGQPELTPFIQDKGIQLQTNISPSIYYLGFNMLDNIVGGYSEKAMKLRRAIAIAINYDDYISIFMNGRGQAAQGPIPPSIFGYQPGEQGVNPYLYDWTNEQLKRKPLAYAKQLLTEAGYPNGINVETGKPLVLNYDVAIGAGPDDKARLNWMRKQFSNIGIQLNVRGTQYNRFQEKIRTGHVQIYMLGWLADYPDPENFLFLLYGPNGKVKHGGENASNYQNREFDQLFEKMRYMKNGIARQAVINRMVDVARRDGPWVWGVNPKDFSLSHRWVKNIRPNAMANNTLKYINIDSGLRKRFQQEWNQPLIWPLWVLLGAIGCLVAAATFNIYKRRQMSRIKRF